MNCLDVFSDRSRSPLRSLWNCWANSDFSPWFNLFQIHLGMWDNDGNDWKIVNGTQYRLQRVGPSYVLFACTREFFLGTVGENITYFAAMQNASSL